jgi:hypothetical protein
MDGYGDLTKIFPALAGRASPAASPETHSLKQDIRDDLVKRRVWFNDHEMADYRNINGKRILCVFDRYESALATLDSGRSVNKGAVVMSGLQSDLYLLFVRENEYPGSPRIGQGVKVDGRMFYIQGSIVYEGVYEFTLKSGAAR